MNEHGSDNPPLLEVQDLRTAFDTDAGPVPVVDGVSLRVPPGATVALVGESGCGKSVTALSIMRLIPEPPGRIANGRVLLADSPGGEPIDLLGLNERRMRAIRGNRIAMIFQEPFVSLNPVCSIGDQIVEAIELHQAQRGRAARAAAIEMLRRVRIPEPEQRMREYPHELSGGMCQRVMIAMALSCNPALLIADEPTTALDVTIQMQILKLLAELQAEYQMSILLITHDLGVVAQIADYVYIMYAGRIVEHAPVKALFAHPLHPYTEALLRCTPRLSERTDRLEPIPGSVPDPTRYPPGCRFHPRCCRSAERAHGVERARTAVKSDPARTVLKRCVERYAAEPSGVPKLHELTPGHFVACWESGGPAPTARPGASEGAERGVIPPLPRGEERNGRAGGRQP